MKISGIKINNYLHFKKKLVIDLTYPKGHPKQGKPLDKVCFLGQSGTGKTTLINLIKYFTCLDESYDKSGIEISNFTKNGIEIIYQSDQDKFSKISNGEPFGIAGWDYGRQPHKKHENIVPYIKTEIEPKIKNRSHLLLNFPFCVVGPSDINDAIKSDLKKGIVRFDAPKSEIKHDPSKGELFIDSKDNIDITNYTSKKVWDFTPENINSIWKIVFKEVSDYINKYKDRQIKLAQDVLGDKNVKTSKTSFKKWEAANPNPIQNLADNCLNAILNKFNLEVETDIEKYPLDTTSNEKYIIIKSKHDGKPVSYPFLSTGSKQIMLTAIPLFFLKPENTIILFDQPETSLYPNIQWELSDIYIKIAPKNNQFFFATHSPIVASSFDPWEVVELYFDENTGCVNRKEYYDTEKERRVNNYTINPKYLRWDSIYKKIFDFPLQGNEERRKQLRILSELESEIKKNGNSKIIQNKLVADYKKLGNLLDWNL